MNDAQNSDKSKEQAILIVHDTPEHLELLNFILRKAGYGVITASNGIKGIEVARTHHPDLVISDVMMPGIDGIELCRQIRADQALRLTPILLVSALRVDSQSAVEGIQAGADDYLEVPYDPMRLIAMVTRLIERKRAEEERLRNETMIAMGSLVAGVAHEVRNPLFGISSTLDAFEARLGKDHEYQRYLDVLRKELDRLNELMGDLLELGKPLAQVFYKGEMEELVACAVRACSALAEKTGVRIENHVTEKLPIIEVDRRRVIQVFLNLLENAIHHCKEAGVVEIDSRAVEEEGKRWLEFTVRDNGAGFRPEDLPKIFDPFFTRRRKGSGLGLAIVQRIMEEHRGQITVGNREEGGAFVTVRFPMKSMN